MLYQNIMGFLRAEIDYREKKYIATLYYSWMYVGETTVEKIFIALDNDALKKSLKFAEKFINEGKEVHLVELEGKDPSEMGFTHFTNLIQKSIPLTQYALMEKKLSLV